MKDFLSGCKNTFHMESDLANENEISSIVEDRLIPKPVNLSNYASRNIPSFASITQIPQNNLAYLNSELVASDMSYMFNGCINLQSVPKLNIDTSQCTNMNGMFPYCESLITIDLSNFNTSNVTDMGYMFYRCYSLEHIEGIIDMKSCTNYDSMFYLCDKLTGVKIKNPPDDFESVTMLSPSQYEIVS